MSEEMTTEQIEAFRLENAKFIYPLGSYVRYDDSKLTYKVIGHSILENHRAALTLSILVSADPDYVTPVPVELKED